jgi:RimJ/RimL family protein N-acetyltransferase
MTRSDLESLLTKETLLQLIHNELAGLQLSPNEYIQLANSILDAALEKKQQNGRVADRYAIDPVTKLPAKSDDIFIRPFEPSEDIELLHRWTNDRAGKEFLLSRLENSATRVDDLAASESNIFGIVCADEKKPIGIVGYLNYDRHQRKAELRKLIGDSTMRGMGYGKKATSLWLSYGIHGLKLRKIYLYTFDTNLRNIRINEELGFKLEGIYRAENIIDGIPKDIIRMSLLLDG